MTRPLRELASHFQRTGYPDVAKSLYQAANLGEDAGMSAELPGLVMGIIEPSPEEIRRRQDHIAGQLEGTGMSTLAANSIVRGVPMLGIQDVTELSGIHSKRLKRVPGMGGPKVFAEVRARFPYLPRQTQVFPNEE